MSTLYLYNIPGLQSFASMIKLYYIKNSTHKCFNCVCTNLKSFSWILKLIFAILFDTFSPCLPTSLKKSAKLSAGIVLSLGIIDFSLLFYEQWPSKILLPSEVISPTRLVLAEWCLPPMLKLLVLNFRKVV